MTRELTPEERALWKDTTKEIRRQESGCVSAPLKRVLSRSKRKVSFALETKSFSPVPYGEIQAPFALERQRIVEAAYGHSLGVEHLRQNKAKNVWAEASLDLHGLTQAQATSQLQHFFFDSQKRGRTWVKVITGKSGIFFTLAPQFLRDNAPFVSGYLYARANDGGSGALYVRIRKK